MSVQTFDWYYINYILFFCCVLQVLASGPGGEEEANPGGPDPGSGDLAGVPGLWSSQCHQC